MRYRVMIPYLEPSYEPSQAANRPAYRAHYTVQAPDEAAAIAAAMTMFEGDALESGVGWIREPLEDAIEVSPL